MNVKIEERPLATPEDEKRLLALQMPDWLRQRIRRDAFERNVSVSAMVRSILTEYYDAKDKAEGN